MGTNSTYNILYIHIPKCAGTTIIEALNLRPPGHYKWSTHPHFGVPGYTSFAVVRNPWDRVVSCYEYARMEESYWHSTTGKGRDGKHPDYDLLKDMTFKECVDLLATGRHRLKSGHWAPQYEYVANDNKIMVDKIIKYETMETDLNEFLATCNVPPAKLPVINESSRRDYRSYYDDETIQIVGNVYKEDIEMFTYKFC